MERILLAPSERADVVVDFSAFRAGTHVHLVNVGPDEPFGGGEPARTSTWRTPGRPDRSCASPWSTASVTTPACRPSS